MKALVTAASRYGSTREIAQAIVDVLIKRGVDTTVRSPEEVEEIEEVARALQGSPVA